MKKIIKSGKKIYQKTCSRCGCEFTYENEDINYIGNVTCPECGCVLAHITTLNSPGYYPITTPGNPWITTTPWYVGDSPFDYNKVTCQQGNTVTTAKNDTIVKQDPSAGLYTISSEK